MVTGMSRTYTKTDRLFIMLKVENFPASEYLMIRDSYNEHKGIFSEYVSTC